MATINKYLKVRKGVDTPDVLTSSATVYDYLKTPLVYFDTTASAAPTIGGMVWDDGEGTLSFGLKGGNVNLQIGQENIALCYNGTASTIANGAVVYISGAQGQKPSIALANAITEEGSSKVFGIATEDISSGAEGFVATFGIVNGVDTSGFTEGDALWLSASSGKLTTTKPLSPTHLVFVGYCLKVNAISGRIFVNPQNGYELEELHDVLINTASTNQTIVYNSASGIWQNKALLEVIKEIDGANSGIDSDLLDGQQGSYYLNWTNTTNKPDPIIGVNLTGNTTGAASATLTDLANGQISITTNTTFATSASSMNWSGVTGRPTTLSGYGITDAIPGSASQAYLTRSDAGIIYAPLASASLTGIPIAPTAASGTNTQQIATTAFVRTEVSNLIASAPATLDTLNELAAALGNDPNFATSTASAIGQRLLASTASTLYMSIGSTANHATSASSINWNGVTNKPDPIIGVSLSGNTTGAASVTLTDITNGQISITTNTAHATTASSINISGITGLGSNVSTFLVTPTSANLASAITDETGTGRLVFSTSASFGGVPTAPTASAGSNSNQIATTAFVYSAITIIDGGTPSSVY